MHGLNSVNGSDDIDDVSDTVVDGVVDKPTIGVVGRCCDKDDGTKPWIGSVHNMANRKVVIMVLGLRCLIMNSLHPSSRHLHHDNLARSFVGFVRRVGHPQDLWTYTWKLLEVKYVFSLYV